MQVSYVQELWESLTTRKIPMGAILKTSKKVGIKGKDLEGLGATTCKDQENKDPNVNVGVLCNKSNVKG